VKIADRVGHILIDWLRNGLGATAVSSFSPRARPGAGVAMPLAWNEVTAKLDPADYTVLTVPGLVAKRKKDPWQAFSDMRQHLPELKATAATERRATGRVVVANKPKPRKSRAEP
jgi:bifunctional non-homologous end joining protein LigD